MDPPCPSRALLSGFDRYPSVHSHDIEDARRSVAQVYGEGLCLDAAAGVGPFDWRAVFVNLGPIAFIPSHFAAAVVVRGVPSGYFVSISHEGHQRTATRKDSAEIAPGRWANVLSPVTRIERTTQGGLYSTAIRVDPRFLEGQLAALTGRGALRPIEFALSMPIDSGPGAAFLRLCAFLLGEIERDTAVFAHPLVLTSFFETMARALLVGQPHSYTSELYAPTPPSGPREVRRAEEYADAHAGDPIGMTDLAVVAGTSIRSLEEGFRVHRGTTPQQHLQSKRLWLSRWRLLQPGSAPCMKDVARSAGFLDPERFDAAYLSEFRESPSETRRRGLIAGGAVNDRLVARDAMEARMESLTAREREVCAHVAEGKLNKQIAAELGITEKTVQVHRGRAMAKLGAKSAVELGRMMALHDVNLGE